MKMQFSYSMFYIEINKKWLLFLLNLAPTKYLANNFLDYFLMI